MHATKLINYVGSLGRWYRYQWNRWPNPTSR